MAFRDGNVPLAGLLKSFLWSVSTPGTTMFMAVIVVWYIKSWYRLRHIPGPLLNSISIAPMNFMTLGGKLSFKLKDLGDRYGPLVRVGPNEVLFGDADSCRIISAVRSDFVKGPWYALSKVVPDQDSLFSLRDDQERKELKSKLSPGYSGRENGGFEPGVDRVVAQFINLIESKYISTSNNFCPIEFSHKSQYFALDVVSEISFGEALGFLAKDKDLFGYVQTNDQIFPVLAIMLNMPWLGIMMQRWPLNKLLPFESDKFGFGRLMGMAKTMVDKCLAAGPGENHMIHSHLRNGVTYKELLAEIFLELIAGSDSTATAIRMTMLCLLTTPTALSRLRHEIATGISRGFISSPIRDAEARQFPYLQAVIREGLRLYPPSTGLNYKQVAKGGTKLFGQFLPEGTQLGVNIQKIMRSKETFGPDADIFRPERWLEAAEDGERFREMTGVVDLAFGHGRFQCLGKTIAVMELNKIFVELLRRFDFAVVRPQEPLRLYDAAFWVTTDFWLRVTERGEAR
ncbi:cytochrome P450 [Colletotrichum graminicola]|uniref:Cytochrome P450 n=1 Tax=Colletotrichum graminicola (strain M1.001 / M2 / FGSC 10212) TaxID=645133 RepID=E3QKX9_COLGM|nr:cytochrome P450 [Colletotrichum graminicola M1.001]EFQ31517.1 cytochrome P450 [Colletotrichum graminicola M1.001]WDK10256.1 cytochrome P450 [Colletotrichum graminicola]